MQNYEITCIISPELTEEETQKIQEKVSSLIQAEGGAVIEVRAAVKKIVFYTSKRKEALSFTLEFQAEPANLQNLDKKMRDEKQITRFFTMVKPKFREMTRRRRDLRKPLVKSSETEVKEPKVKVEIAEIEKKLEEILGKTDLPPTP
ncbi:MAG: 30S ribosomal protein S6 [bacterium]|nr:30S ribosomal protein S6 [bacterium]